MGRLQGGGIVHPVAGHRDPFARGLKGLHNAQLLRWRDACAHGHGLEASLQGRIAQGGQFLTGQHAIQSIPGRDQPRFGRDSSGSRRVVPGDHQHTNAGSVALRHGRSDLGPQGVGQTQQTNELEIKVMFNGGPMLTHKTCLSHPEHPQTFGRHGLHGTGNARLRVASQMTQIHNGLG
jgi:hypothetical protein